MTTRVIKDSGARAGLYKLLEARPYPYTVEIVKGEKRSMDQNRLQWLWANEAAQQLQDENTADKRAWCKLHIGIPILRADSTTFREQYDAVVRPMPYETKFALMREPFDFPVSRLMTTDQMARYLNAIWDHFTGLGVTLTNPDDDRWGIPRRTT